MNKWSFLVSKQWLGYLGLLVLFCIICVSLGFWQLDRRESILAENARITNNWDTAAIALTELESDYSRFDIENTWQKVSLSGHYLPEEQVLARVRPYLGKPGFEILSPFQLDSGAVVVVNRGWLSKGFEQDYPDVVPAPPEGEIDLVVRLKATEPFLNSRQAPAGQVASIYVPAILEKMNVEGYSQFYGALVSESRAAPSGILAPRPQLTEGPHLSYSLQWFVFAGMAIIGFGYFATQNFRRLHPDDQLSIDMEERQKRRAAQKYRDEDIEDALLDKFDA
ncbi:MAG: SURF1 family protein [Microbacteriaceae bacterium]